MIASFQSIVDNEHIEGNTCVRQESKCYKYIHFMYTATLVLFITSVTFLGRAVVS